MEESLSGTCMINGSGCSENRVVEASQVVIQISSPYRDMCTEHGQGQRGGDTREVPGDAADGL